MSDSTQLHASSPQAQNETCSTILLFDGMDHIVKIVAVTPMDGGYLRYEVRIYAQDFAGIEQMYPSEFLKPSKSLPVTCEYYSIKRLPDSEASALDFDNPAKTLNELTVFAWNYIDLELQPIYGTTGEQVIPRLIEIFRSDDLLSDLYLLSDSLIKQDLAYQ